MASMGNAQRGALGGLAKLGEGARTTSDLSRVGGGLSRGANEGKKLNAAPWSDTFPAAGATLDLDFANNRGFVRGVGQGGVMDAITFTRASNGNYVNENGLLVGGGTGNQTGANLLTFPQDFDNAAWSKGNVTVLPKAELAPNKTYTANLIVENNTFNQHSFNQNYTGFVAGQPYCFSVFAKSNGRFLQLILPGAVIANSFANFDLINGVVTASAGTGLITEITDAGDGWWRCFVATNSSSSTTSGTPTISLANSESMPRLSLYSGDGESGIFIWGAQLEVGSTATEYFPTNIGEPRFDWASTEQVAQINQLLGSQTFASPFWIVDGLTVTAAAATAPDGTATAYTVANGTGNNRMFQFDNTGILGNKVFSIYGKSDVGSELRIVRDGSLGSGVLIANLSDGTISGGTVGSTITDVGSGWYRIAVPVNVNFASNNATFWTIRNTGDSVFIWGAQLESGTSATTYQATAQVPTTTPLRANPTSNGILIEEARTNRLLWNRDATQTEWVKTNITATKDQTGIDGVANAASSLTATDDNGTCIQTITLGAGNRTGSVYLKRLTGTGLIQVTLDGSTYSTVELSDTEWYRIVLSGNVTNPTVGIKIAVDSDAVAMDYGQVEDGLFATSPILTTTATATRANETAQLTLPFSDGFIFQGSGTIIAEMQAIGSAWVGLRRIGAGDFVRVLVSSPNTTYTYNCALNFVNQLNSIITEPSIGFNKYSFSYKPALFVGSKNGSQKVLSNGLANGLIPLTLNELQLGSNPFNATGHCSYIKKVVYLPFSLSQNGNQEVSRAT
jgi:hypothetical protein